MARQRSSQGSAHYDSGSRPLGKSAWAPLSDRQDRRASATLRRAATAIRQDAIPQFRGRRVERARGLRGILDFTMDDPRFHCRVEVAASRLVDAKRLALDRNLERW